MSHELSWEPPVQWGEEGHDLFWKESCRMTWTCILLQQESAALTKGPDDSRGRSTATVQESQRRGRQTSTQHSSTEPGLFFLESQLFKKKDKGWYNRLIL